MAERAESVRSHKTSHAERGSAPAPPRPTGNVTRHRAVSGASDARDPETPRSSATAVEERPRDAAATPETEEPGSRAGTLLQALQGGAPAREAGAATKAEAPAAEGSGKSKESGKTEGSGPAAEGSGRTEGSGKTEGSGSTEGNGKTESKKPDPDAARLRALNSTIESVGALIDALAKRRGSVSGAAFSAAVDQARTLLDMLGCAVAGKEYNPADFMKRFNNLISSWRQSSEGNCVSVATIKAAMHKWGNRVFLDQKAAADGGWDLTLRDGARIHLSPQELETARRLSRFKGQDAQALSYANLCYAAMAKRALQAGHEGARTFAWACHSLNNGEAVYYPAKLLGISKHLRSISVREIPRHEIVLAWNAGHMIYGTNGVTDAWGRAASPWRWGLSGAYVLV